ncbi:MAG TPA: EAL domain-containing protein [Candidatus Sulfotelmatobacter sp.]|nr:EAL domain-containing protein [Candidatus Sulfotelmatobacter sp.]
MADRPTKQTTAAREEVWTEQVAALARLEPAASAEETADRLCRALTGLRGIEAAVFVGLAATDRATVLASSARGHAHLGLDQPLPVELAARLRDRLDDGPWVGPWEIARGPRDRRRPIVPEPTAMAVLPVRNGSRAVGALIVGATGGDGIPRLADRLPGLESFAALGSALLGAELAARAQRDLVEGAVAGVLAQRAFAPVFQPVVALESGLIVGYEALTRFRDGVRPERRFAEATSVGRGVDLEVACVEAALDDASALQATPWLSLNVSPATVLEGGRLRRLLARAARDVVIEVSEHQPIDDYPAFRTAFRSLGRELRLAVDDAGAGFATYRHLARLRPDFIKIDMGLVHGLERDPARQALVAGLVQFAAGSGSVLIAEGIETPEGHAALQDLGVGLGQGFLLGRPGPVASLMVAGSRSDAGSFAGLS